MQNSIGFQIKKTKTIMEREYNKYLKPYGISIEQGILLGYIYEVPGCSQTELAEALYKDKTSVTRMIDTLVKKGLVERKPDPNDRRSICLYLTKEGKDGADELDPVFEKDEKALEALLDKKDVEATLRVLRQMEEYFKGLN